MVRIQMCNISRMTSCAFSVMGILFILEKENRKYGIVKCMSFKNV